MADKGAVGRKVGYTAAAAVRKWVVVVGPIGFAAGTVEEVVVHRAVEPGVDSTALEAPDLTVATGEMVIEDTETAPGDMEIEAVVLVVAEEACYTPTVLEDTVKMCHRNLELLVAQMVTVAARTNQDAGAWEVQAVAAAHKDLAPARRWADRRCS